MSALAEYKKKQRASYQFELPPPDPMVEHTCSKSVYICV